MTIRELVKMLLDADDLDRVVCVYDERQAMLYNVTLVDLSLTDRVDINIGEAV